MMPDVMRIYDFAANEPGLPHLLEAMGREVAMDRVGAGGILARLADVVAATIIRNLGRVRMRRLPRAGSQRRAARDRAGARRRPRSIRTTDWTVEAWPALMGASRSGFAERFAEVVGETPARYVAQVRMHQARQWLARDKLRIAVVAQRLGYESEASFSRAFKRITGSAPSQVRAAGGQQPTAMFAPSAEAAE